MTRSAPAFALMVAALLLAGCSAAPSPAQEISSPTPSPEPVNPNVEACASFYDILDDMLVVLDEGSSTQEDWAAVGGDLDAVGLKAEGIVQDRILSVTEDFPSFGEVLFDDTDLPTNLEAISRACAADLE